MKVSWVKYKDMGGPRYKGEHVYNPQEPMTEWDRIMGVVARCEGRFDTTVMYDETGVTFGFLQWTFKSGRLQKLIESFKTIPFFDMTTEEGDGHDTLFEDILVNQDVQVFRDFGFAIHGGKFVSANGFVTLDPRKKSQQKRIVDICMGRESKTPRQHAMGLCKLFADIGQDIGVHAAQIEFAKAEFRREMEYKRPPLGDIKTIRNLLDGTWDTPAPALFFNLWQNSPGAAYRLFKSVKKSGKTGQEFFDLAWKKTNRSKFGNWGWGKPGNKSPRVTRIKKAMKEFYGINLPYYK